MKNKLLISSVILLIAVGIFYFSNSYKNHDFELDKIEFYDYTRDVTIPLKFYFQEVKPGNNNNLPLIFLHFASPKKFDFNNIKSSLINFGYNIILTEYDPQKKIIDSQFTKESVEDISFIISELMRKYLFLNLDNIIFISDAEGSDLIIDFYNKYPENIKKIILIDSESFVNNANISIPLLFLNTKDKEIDKYNSKSFIHELLKLLSNNI